MKYRPIPLELHLRRQLLGSTSGVGGKSFKLTIANIRLFLSKIERKENECWKFNTNSIQKYPKHSNISAHRIAYELFTGKAIEDGMTIDHLCFNTRCVNPAHLEEVSAEENIKRYLAKTKPEMVI